MSRYDYADPGQDPRYCDGLEHIDEPEDCAECEGVGEVGCGDDTCEVCPYPCLACGGTGVTELPERAQ